MASWIAALVLLHWLHAGAFRDGAAGALEDVDFELLLAEMPPAHRVFLDALDAHPELRSRVWEQLCRTSHFDRGLALVGCERHRVTCAKEAEQIADGLPRLHSVQLDYGEEDGSAGSGACSADRDGRRLRQMQYDPDLKSHGVGLLLLAVDGHEFERLLVLDMEHLAIGAVIFSQKPSVQARMYMFAQFYVPWNGDEAVWLRTDRQWPTAWIYNERNASYTDPEFLIGACIENLSPELHEPDFVVSWTWRPDPPLWLCSHSDCLDHELFERSGATST